MTDYNATGNYYTIGHVVQFSGLSDRTVRSYIASGLLQGEKINGLWHFTAKQVEDFMSHPTVRPSIQAKRNAIISDFLLDNKKRTPQSCMILDLPGADEEKLNEYFSHEIMSGELHDFRFSLDCGGGVPRVILRGRTEELLALVSGFCSTMEGADGDGTL
ncbi:MAG: helix-turn-helix domain-containing protein [Oscillospiraceae bacterium]|nr:helix-turn-helix domain-containing protein [Oscillospiraceae bacterium]